MYHEVSEMSSAGQVLVTSITHVRAQDCQPRPRSADRRYRLEVGFAIVSPYPSMKKNCLVPAHQERVFSVLAMS